MGKDVKGTGLKEWAKRRQRLALYLLNRKCLADIQVELSSRRQLDTTSAVRHEVPARETPGLSA